ncbi:hypothetical protein AGDE_08682 [Angomonas deanei]|nr:hypothetical protein AGDE_08682 [Angomonas deanei]|eukprot:EPY32451.1 hypothetical protein AGDE_08682 [Angomonas deanei]
MEKIHYELWGRCRDFVEKVCAGRDPTHGLEHMETVAERALLIYFMLEPSLHQLAKVLDICNIILVGMLHDVADHKYDVDGTLQKSLADFCTTEVEEHLTTIPGLQAPDAAEKASFLSHLHKTIDCILSKEKSRGLRYYEKELPAEWLVVRNCVSDADKLEAIGPAGLLRCYEYSCARTSAECKKHPEKRFDSIAELEAYLLGEVDAHHDEKLSILSSSYIVTPPGKFLSKSLDDSMLALLQKWKKSGPPSVTSYWPDCETVLR